MSSVRKRNWLTNAFNWYFSKRVLPYWCILLVDTLIVFVSCMFAYWLNRRAGIMFENIVGILYTSLFYSVLSWVGVRIFKTYSGVLRYSSFVDLLRVAQDRKSVV